MEFLVTNWLYFLIGAIGCGLGALLFQLRMMSQMDKFFDEGFSFFQRALPQILLGAAAGLSGILFLVGIVGKLLGVETGAEVQ